MQMSYVKFGNVHVAEPTKKRAVLFVHGGGWVKGSVDNANLKDVEEFTLAGYAVGKLEYRLATPQEPSYPGVLWDIQRGVNQMRNLGYTDVTLVGTSAGANLSLASSIHYNRVFKKIGRHKPADRQVLMYGIYDYDIPLSSIVQPMWEQYIGERHSDPVYVRSANPVIQVKSEPELGPILVMHGTKDPVVDINQSESLVATLESMGREGNFIVVEGGVHGFSPLPFFDDIVEFTNER
jgi:acetyl esterase/lipase